MRDFDLSEYLDRRRREVDAALGRLLPPEDAPPPRIHQAMRYAVFAGGKRLRPILVLAGCEAAGGSPVQAVPLACAVECIHTYSLVHDDLPSLDNDDLRRGLPTVHKAFDEPTAILAGDALLTFAFEAALGPIPPEGLPPGEGRAEVSVGLPPPDVHSRCGRTDDHPAFFADEGDRARERLRALRVIVSAIGTRGMIGGQVADILATGLAVDEALVRSIHERKTGALLRACPVIGGIVAGADEVMLGRLDSYGADLGLAFQIIDDILDIEGTPVVLGKTVGKDAATGKATFPAAIGVESSRRIADELALRARSTASGLGPAGTPLVALADYVVRRKR